jgi:hypothetical protein
MWKHARVISILTNHIDESCGLGWVRVD